MTAVIYARYSSDNQREESIEGQIRECTAYAEKNGITIVKHYIDRAISAKTDNRPEFQQMIKDSDKKLFDIVLVWKLDRFARNRYDSARYKTQLKKNGVKLMSATEIISEGPEGIILESVLEGYAEYYSADLAEKVVRGQTENILKGRCNGGRGTFGYTLDSERKFHIDPLTSPFVLESFKKYNEGSTMKEIRDWLNENGIKNPVGGAFTYNSVEHMLKNRRYIGELKFRDVVVPDAIPPIIPLELFEDVQEKIAKNKKAPARRKAEDDYLLTTKLFCGYCGALMFGESGTSRTGEVHRYYKCATAKKHKGCKKKTVRKQWLEDLVVNQTMQLVKDDAAMESIIAKVMELQNKENTNIPLYEKQLRDAESGIQNMLNAIQAGILTSSTKERLEQLEETKRELEARIAEEKLAKPKVTEEFIRFWLLRFRKLDMSLKDQRQALVDTFINAIYLYDDKVLITFNYKEGTQTVTFGEAAEAASKGNGSDLDCFTAPENAVKSKDFMAFLFCKPWVHGFCTVFARSVFSMSDDVGRCIALQSVPFFASGEQCQAQLCLHFRVGILEQFQESRHGDGGFACGGYSLWAGDVGLGIEAAFKLLAQLHTGGLLDMGVGVHQHICAGVSFCTRCIERSTVKVPMPLAASKSMSSGVRPATSPSRSAPTSVRCTARCRIGPPCCPVLPASPPPPRCCALGWESFPICRSSCRARPDRCTIFQFPLAIFDCSCYDTGRNRMCKKYSAQGSNAIFTWRGQTHHVCGLGVLQDLLLCGEVSELYQGCAGAGQQPAQYHPLDEPTGKPAELRAVHPLQPGCDPDTGRRDALLPHRFGGGADPGC